MNGGSLRMAELADRISEAVAALWEHLTAQLDGAWTRRDAGIVVGVTGAPAAPLNGLWVIDPGAPAARIDALLAELARTGLPHCLEVRPPSAPEVAAVAERRGMVRDDDLPLMCTATVSRAPHSTGLPIRRLAPDEAALHVQVAAAGFDAPPVVFAAVMTERVLGGDGVRAYVGEVAGEAVATAVAVTRAGTVGIFNVATLPAHRGRGYGAAITAQAARDGLADGAEYAWLQSSPMGVRLYESIGFATLESWRCWVTPPPAGAEPVASRP